MLGIVSATILWMMESSMLRHCKTNNSVSLMARSMLQNYDPNSLVGDGKIGVATL